MILDEILETKRAEVAARQAAMDLTSVRRQAERARATASFARALRGSGVSIIAEIKRKSPSGGALRPDLTPSDLATTYARSGAAALSVLTDFTYFGGTDEDLVIARESSGLPVLRKDFVVDEYQVYEARAIGASALLLIVRALDEDALRSLLQLAYELGLDALVETHSASEVETALKAGARIVGVNNRDLDTLTTDPSLALRLRPLVPAGVVYVAESGIHDPRQMVELAEARVDSALIGESLVRAPDPAARLRSLFEAGQRAAVPR